KTVRLTLWALLAGSRRDGGLVLAAAAGIGVDGFGLLRNLKLRRSHRLVRDAAALELGSGPGGCLPGGGSSGGPFLVAGAGGFDPPTFAGQLAGESSGVCGLGVVVSRGRVGMLAPGVGFGLGDAAQLAGDV